MNCKLLTLTSVALSCSFVSHAQVTAVPPPLLVPTERTGPVKDADPSVIRARNVLVNVQLLRSADIRSVVVPLFDGEQVVLVRDRQSVVGKTGIIWAGHETNEPNSTAVFSVVNNVLIGNIRTQKGRLYQIRYTGDGVHSLREIDPRRFPREAPSPLRVPALKPILANADTCSTDPPSDIDSLIVYTPATRAAAGGTDAIEATIYLAVEEANTTYINSNISQRLRVVHVEEVSFPETGDFDTDVRRLQNGTDGFGDNVQTLRNTYAADVVGMIVEESMYCGASYDTMSPVSNAFESSAYSIVNRSCAAGNYSLAHEFGHLMGARHDWFTDSTANSAFPFNHGYVNVSPTPPAAPWRTVMAYPDSCGGCVRVPYWSNPNINYPPGDPMGIATGSQQSDNHRTLNSTALTVANFRCSSPSPPNVWMKDTWDDTGAEPDPHTAGEDMWKSPYIWIRNTQDTNLTHQHEHQNPEFGSANWVYVKLHNGGATSATGNLELYWAHASTGLSWPADWTLLTLIPVTAFASHSTKIVEYKWNSLPGIGHYCLLARWVSPADPMRFPETSDISSNVRNNNNLIWRNLNIVDLSHDKISSTTFLMRNSGDRTGMTLIIRPPSNELATSFIGAGTVAVSFDAQLLRAWQQGGAKGKGFRTEGGQLVISDPAGAVFEAIMLQPKMTGEVKLVFTKLPTTPKRVFHLDTVQLPATEPAINSAPAQSRPTGGVSYEITTEMTFK